MLKEKEVDYFLAMLQQELHSMFGIVIDKADWKVMRQDVCWNFYVGEKGLHQTVISLLKLPKMKTCAYNQIESVSFSNKSKRILFYDKERESIAHHAAADVVDGQKVFYGLKSNLQTMR